MFAIDLDGDGKADIVSSSAHKFGIWGYLQKPGGDHPEFLKTDLFPQPHGRFRDARRALRRYRRRRHQGFGDGQAQMVARRRSEPGSSDPPRLYWFKGSKASDGTLKFTPNLIDEDSGIGTQFSVLDFRRRRQTRTSLRRARTAFTFSCNNRK